MKSVIRAFFIVAIYYFYCHDGTTAQNPDYPHRFFVPIKFDYLLRGTYKGSECLEEMMQCWEAIRPYRMCTQWRLKDDLCTNMRDYCHDEHGDFPLTWFRFDLTETICVGKEVNEET